MSREAGATPPPNTSAELVDSAWQSAIARPLMIALQSTCLIAGPLVMVQAITQDERLRAITVLSFLAALLGVASAQWMADPKQRLLSRTTFQIAELALLLLVVRVITWGVFDRWPTLQTAQEWLVEPWRFLDGGFLAAGILSALAWHRASVVAGIFHRLALTPAELAWYQQHQAGSSWRSDRPVEHGQVSREELVADYVTQWLVGGGFLVFFAGATQVRVGPNAGLSVLKTGVPPALVVAVIFYFLIGLILTSQARLAMLRAHWVFDGVELPEQLPGRWQRFSLAIILGIGLVATLLPLGSTWQLGAILNILVTSAVQAVFILVGLFIAALSWILALFGQQPQMPELPVTLEPAPPVPPPPPVVALPPWLGGATLWLLVGGIVIYLLVFLFGKQGIDFTRATLRRAWRRLHALLSSWWRGLRELPLSLPGRARMSAPPTATLRQPWRFIRLGALSPRDQVRYFYLSTVRRAGNQGVTRKPSQTPIEFVRDLETTWPEAELDVVTLTEAFVVARYDTAEIAAHDAQQVKSVWERIKRLLRKHQPPSGHTSAVSEPDELRDEP
jgi:hypothetical protein